MKILLYTILFLISLCSVYASVQDFSENLVVYYSFDNNISSDIGNYPLTQTGTTTSVGGIIGNARRQTGTGNYLRNLNFGNAVNTSSVTFNIWFLQNQEATAGSGFGITLSPVGSTLGFQIHNEAYYRFLSSYGTSTNINTNNYYVTDDEQWIMMTYVYNNPDNSLKMYRNGVLLNSSFLASTEFDLSAHHLYVGTSQSATNTFLGNYDELSIWNTALSDSAISEIYTYNNDGVNLIGILQDQALYGNDYNITYYKNFFPYYYQYNNVSNEGYVIHNLTQEYIFSDDCRSNKCYNKTIEDTYNLSFKENHAFNFGTWFKGTLADSEVLRIDTDNNEYVSFAINDSDTYTIEVHNEYGTYHVSNNFLETINTSRYNFLSFATIYNGYYVTLNNRTTSNFYSQNGLIHVRNFTGNTNYIRFGYENITLDDTFFYTNTTLNFTKVDYMNQQFMYYTEEHINKTLYPILPPINLTIYAVCNEVITLANNVSEERTFNWSEAYDPQYLTINYAIRINNLYILNETTNNSYNYTFSTPPFTSNTYTSEVTACNPYECVSDSCEFDICLNNYQSIFGVCVNGEQLKTYIDLNNCPISYNVPIDNNTYIVCTGEATSSEQDYIFYKVLFSIIFFVIFLVLGFQAPIFFILAGLLCFFTTFNLYVYYELQSVLIIGIIGSILIMSLTAFRLK